MSNICFIIFCFKIRDILREGVPYSHAYHHGAADVIHLWAHTQTFFTVNEKFKSVKSEPFTMEDLGYPDQKLAQENMAAGKVYGSQYVWGQLMFWMKQTIDKPDASLSQSR